MSKPTCETCRHSVDPRTIDHPEDYTLSEDRLPPAGLLACMRYPPVFARETWPTVPYVAPFWWCGEHKPREVTP